MKITEVKVDGLQPYPNNPRKSNVDILAESLEVNGQYRPIVIQKSTNQIIAGNHLWEASKKLGWETISAIILDVDDEQAKKIVVADNRLADLGSYDDEVLLELLEGLDLNGTGYTQSDIDDLLAVIDEGVALSELRVDVEDPHQNNIKNRETLTEKADRYLERTVRLLMAEYPNDTFIWVQERLAEITEKYGCESNADAILKALSITTGKEM